MTFIDHFARADGALGNDWGHHQSADLWTLVDQCAVSGTTTGRNPNMSRSLAHLGTKLRKGFTFSFRWQHNQNSNADTTPGMIFTLDPQGVAGLGQLEVKPQISDGHMQYQFQFWGGDTGDYNPVSANDVWHDVEYIVYPTAVTLIVDGTTLANRVTHTLDLSVFDNPILSFYCESNEGPGIDPTFKVDHVKVIPTAETVGILEG